jgi:hypothetical protein
MIDSLRKFPRILPGFLVILSLSFSVSALRAQDWVKTGSGLAISVFAWPQPISSQSARSADASVEGHI